MQVHAGSNTQGPGPTPRITDTWSGVSVSVRPAILANGLGKTSVDRADSDL